MGPRNNLRSDCREALEVVAWSAETVVGTAFVLYGRHASFRLGIEWRWGRARRSASKETILTRRFSTLVVRFCAGWWTPQTTTDDLHVIYGVLRPRGLDFAGDKVWHRHAGLDCMPAQGMIRDLCNVNKSQSPPGACAICGNTVVLQCLWVHSMRILMGICGGPR